MTKIANSLTPSPSTLVPTQRGARSSLRSCTHTVTRRTPIAALVARSFPSTLSTPGSTTQMQSPSSHHNTEPSPEHCHPRPLHHHPRPSLHRRSPTPLTTRTLRSLRQACLLQLLQAPDLKPPHQALQALQPDQPDQRVSLRQQHTRPQERPRPR